MFDSAAAAAPAAADEAARDSRPSGLLRSSDAQYKLLAIAAVDVDEEEEEDVKDEAGACAAAGGAIEAKEAEGGYSDAAAARLCS
jgi:hypothetical protein